MLSCNTIDHYFSERHYILLYKVPAIYNPKNFDPHTWQHTYRALWRKELLILPQTEISRQSSRITRQIVRSKYTNDILIWECSTRRSEAGSNFLTGPARQSYIYIYIYRHFHVRIPRGIYSVSFTSIRDESRGNTSEGCGAMCCSGHDSRINNSRVISPALLYPISKFIYVKHLFPPLFLRAQAMNGVEVLANFSNDFPISGIRISIERGRR